MSADLPLQLVGTQAFLPALHAYIRNVANSPSLPLDHVIFRSLLLCLIAGDKHLILRTPEEDVGLTVKLTVWTLSYIFNLPTRKLKIRSRPAVKSDPAAFLRSLFLPSGTSSSANSSQDEGADDNLKHAGHQRQRAHSKQRKSKSPEYARSRSFPNNLGQTESVAAPPPSILKPQPIYPGGAAGPSRLPNSFTEPVPSIHRRRKTRSHSSRELPRALVVSGLENGSNSMQRAFSDVLSEKRVVLEGQEDGVWNLPEGFITVYVCPWNARERPAIHKTLLDKFAMSTNVFISQNIRRELNLLPFSPAPRPFHPDFLSHSNPGSPSPTVTIPLPPTHTPPTFTKPLPIHRKSSSSFNPPVLQDTVLPYSFIKSLQQVKQNAYISWRLQLYLSDIFSATRHHSRLDAMLLTAKSMKDAEDLVKASRVVGNDLTGMELVRPTLCVDDQELELQPSEELVVLEEEEEGGEGEEEQEEQEEETSERNEDNPVDRVLDVSEVDIARIVPRVVSHRVRLRDGPEDEMLSSALFGATFKPPPEVLQTDEVPLDSVKKVLVQILSDV
ncbi:hypothetical protein M413DRAFT_442188 [Hebeloma cylindrosporum]|uniref:Uncharacterized protein n=1 Tax=Hebeloma cylindrosporum TaxID=76867 RepID=A0A0C2YWZ9_HEBCY|nr:hypothetical protein M413DRAFT_442188 [Hebeloma cylindrosporum h7]